MSARAGLCPRQHAQYRSAAVFLHIPDPHRPATVAAEQFSSRCPLATRPIPRLQHTHCSPPARSSTPNMPVRSPALNPLAHCRPVKPHTQPARCPPPARSPTLNPPAHRSPGTSRTNPSTARRHPAGLPHPTCPLTAVRLNLTPNPPAYRHPVKSRTNPSAARHRPVRSPAPNPLDAHPKLRVGPSSSSTLQ